MKLVDANVLLYAVNEDALHHELARQWLDKSLSGAASVGFAWVPLLAFVRLVTKIGLFAKPLPVQVAVAQVEDWLAQPAAHLLEPTARHAAVLNHVLTELGTGGNLVNDAHLVALAIEHRAQIVSFDNDFGRFPSIRWGKPEL